MAITKTEFKNRIKRYFGYPYVKVELHDDQLEDVINRTRSIHQKWAVGNATQEVFFTIPVSAYKRDYKMPTGVVSVIDMKDYTANLSNANRLFTIENYMYTHGLFRFLEFGNTFSMVDYHMALDFLDLIDRYTVSKFAWRYQQYKNTLTLTPYPTSADTADNSYMLIRSFMAEGYDIDYDPLDNDYLESFYEDPWVYDYSIALAKITLGHVRRKFANFQSIGNTGISLDGDSLINEGKEEKQQLEEDLRNNEVYEGWPIIFG